MNYGFESKNAECGRLRNTAADLKPYPNSIPDLNPSLTLTPIMHLYSAFHILSETVNCLNNIIFQSVFVYWRLRPIDAVVSHHIETLTTDDGSEQRFRRLGVGGSGILQKCVGIHQNMSFKNKNK